MMTRPDFALDDADARRVAVGLFNHVWSLMDIADRTPAQDDEMVHAVHASRHHWSAIGGPENFARGEWQCSRVYAVLGRGEPALHHASRCLALCLDNGFNDWDLAYAYEAVARAHATAGDLEAAREAVAQARAVSITDAESATMLESDLATVETLLAAS